MQSDNKLMVDTFYIILFRDQLNNARFITDILQSIPNINSKISTVQIDDKTFHISSQNSHWKISIHNEPFGIEHIENAVQLCWFRDFLPSELKDLSNHKSRIVIQLSQKKQDPLFNSREIAWWLRFFLGIEGAIGILNTAAQHYTSIRLLDIFYAEELESLSIFKLLMNLHIEKYNKKLWCHTHGMQQIGLPDIELWAHKKAIRSELSELLLNAAHYQMIGEGVLKIGDIFKLTTENVTYEIAPSRSILSEHFSENGAIQLVVRKK